MSHQARLSGLVETQTDSSAHPHLISEHREGPKSGRWEKMLHATVVSVCVSLRLCLHASVCSAKSIALLGSIFELLPDMVSQCTAIKVILCISFL